MFSSLLMFSLIAGNKTGEYQDQKLFLKLSGAQIYRCYRITFASSILNEYQKIDEVGFSRCKSHAGSSSTKFILLLLQIFLGGGEFRMNTKSDTLKKIKSIQLFILTHQATVNERVIKITLSPFLHGLMRQNCPCVTLILLDFFCRVL